MTTLILIRHGNTFNAGEPSRMVGKAEDFPLVEKGFQQATLMGEALQKAGIIPTTLYSSPALRCRQTAQTMAQAAGWSLTTPTVDNRLGELDYGTWSGKTDAEVAAIAPEGTQEAWRKQGIIPQGAEWDVATCLPECQSFLADMAGKGGTIVATTHGGRIRFFREALLGERTQSLKTAQAAVLQYKNNTWHILGWDVIPTPELF